MVSITLIGSDATIGGGVKALFDGDLPELAGADAASLLVQARGRNVADADAFVISLSFLASASGAIACPTSRPTRTSRPRSVRTR